MSELSNPRLLLNALKEARAMVADWGAYASNYFQEKHNLADDLKRLDDVIIAGEKALWPCQHSDAKAKAVNEGLESIVCECGSILTVAKTHIGI